MIVDPTGLDVAAERTRATAWYAGETDSYSSVWFGPAYKHLDLSGTTAETLL